MRKTIWLKAIAGIAMMATIMASGWMIGDMITGRNPLDDFMAETQKINDGERFVVQMDRNSEGEGNAGVSDVEEPVFTPATLKTFNGLNGEKAYVAVDGLVYDLTGLASWAEGTHFGVTAGQDASEAFRGSPHGLEVLEKAEVVGVYIEDEILAAALPESAGVENEVSDVVVVDESEETEAIGDETVATSAVTRNAAVRSSGNTNVYTEATLKTYNGVNGNPAYIAVDGVVYDVSGIAAWSGGTHFGVSSGKDVTAEFALSPHSKSILEKAVIVGIYDEEVPVSAAVDSVSSATVSVTNEGTNTTAANSEAETQSTQDPTTQAIQEPTTQPTQESVTQSVVANTSLALTDPTLFTLQTLASYNGRNGAPAYIAVQGTVYDVTNVSGWSGGSHHGISAGQDLSVAFSSSPHSYSILSMAKIVGSLVLDPNDPTNAVDAVSSATVRPTGGQEFDDDEHEHENEDHDEYEHEEDDDDEHEDEHEEDDD